MQFYFRQFTGDENIQCMDLKAIGAHILFMCYAGASESGYRLAYSGIKLRRMLRNVSQGDFDQIMEQLLEGPWKISKCGNFIEQDGMRRTLEKQREFSKKQKENARKRWDTSGNAKRYAKPMPESMPESMPEKCPSSSSSSSTSVQKKKYKKKLPSKGITHTLENSKFSKKFYSVWSAWIEMRKELPPPKSWPDYFNRIWEKLHTLTEGQAIELLEYSTLNEYKNIIWERLTERKSINGNRPELKESAWSLQQRIEALKKLMEDQKEKGYTFNNKSREYEWEAKAKGNYQEFKSQLSKLQRSLANVDE